jgi:hypothetical protein
VSRARYVIRCERHEALAHAELRDVGGARRVEVGSFRSVGEARAACERHAAGLCVREQAAVPVDVRIAPVRKPTAQNYAVGGRIAKAGKGRELAAGNYRPREPGGLSIADKPVRARDQAPAGRRPWGTSPQYEQRRQRREPDHAGIDAALRAFADVLGDEG